jgi:glycosyltransferase involved in cell wall biosynthesis
VSQVVNMIILFVSPRYHTNQIPFVRFLISQGHEVAFDVIRTGQSEDHSLLTPHLMTVSKRRSRLLPDVAAYQRRLRALKPDVIVIRGLPRHYAVTAATAARLSRIPIVLVTEGPVHAEPALRRDLMRSLVMRTFAAPMYSPVAGDRRHPKTHPTFHYIPFAADLPDRAKASWFEAGSSRVLTIGKFIPRKNHLLLVRAVHALRQRLDVKLTIIGEVSTPSHQRHHAEVEAEIAALGLEADVTVRTNLSHAEVKREFLSHDLFVLPSRSEPASVSILEGMAFGLPVICSSTNGTRWYIEHGRNGFVFRSDDLEDLEAKIDQALVDRDALTRMGAHSRHLAATVHAPESIYHSFVGLVARPHRVGGP